MSALGQNLNLSRQCKLLPDSDVIYTSPLASETWHSALPDLPLTVPPIPDVVKVFEIDLVTLNCYLDGKQYATQKTINFAFSSSVTFVASGGAAHLNVLKLLILTPASPVKTAFDLTAVDELWHAHKRPGYSALAVHAQADVNMQVTLTFVKSESTDLEIVSEPTELEIVTLDIYVKRQYTAPMSQMMFGPVKPVNKEKDISDNGINGMRIFMLPHVPRCTHHHIDGAATPVAEYTPPLLIRKFTASDATTDNSTVTLDDLVDCCTQHGLPLSIQYEHAAAAAWPLRESHPLEISKQRAYEHTLQALKVDPCDPVQLAALAAVGDLFVFRLYHLGIRGNDSATLIGEPQHSAVTSTQLLALRGMRLVEQMLHQLQKTHICGQAHAVMHTASGIAARQLMQGCAAWNNVFVKGKGKSNAPFVKLTRVEQTVQRIREYSRVVVQICSGRTFAKHPFEWPFLCLQALSLVAVAGPQRLDDRLESLTTELAQMTVASQKTVDPLSVCFVQSMRRVGCLNDLLVNTNMLPYVDLKPAVKAAAAAWWHALCLNPRQMNTHDNSALLIAAASGTDGNRMLDADYCSKRLLKVWPNIWRARCVTRQEFVQYMPSSSAYTLQPGKYVLRVPFGDTFLPVPATGHNLLFYSTPVHIRAITLDNVTFPDSISPQKTAILELNDAACKPEEVRIDIQSQQMKLSACVCQLLNSSTSKNKRTCTDVWNVHRLFSLLLLCATTGTTAISIAEETIDFAVEFTVAAALLLTNCADTKVTITCAPTVSELLKKYIKLLRKHATSRAGLLTLPVVEACFLIRCTHNDIA